MAEVLTVKSMTDWKVMIGGNCVSRPVLPYDLAWHSDHLACTVVAGENVGTMFALPRTEEALDLVCERVRRMQDCYRAPFLLEAVVVGPDGLSRFEELRRRASARNAILYEFDLIERNGEERSLTQRRRSDP
jgi:hypothetical protein